MHYTDLVIKCRLWKYSLDHHLGHLRSENWPKMFAERSGISRDNETMDGAGCLKMKCTRPYKLGLASVLRCPFIIGLTNALLYWSEQRTSSPFSLWSRFIWGIISRYVFGSYLCFFNELNNHQFNAVGVIKINIMKITFIYMKNAFKLFFKLILYFTFETL